jgi:3-isopropylmalate/(R)-2-methylmalate dehydratase small subunit
VISTSVADIFYNNCFKTGILPIMVTPVQLALLMDDAERGSNATLSVDLEAQTIRGPDGGEIHFDIDPARKTTLLEGLDDIAMTLKADPVITGFEGKMAQSRPWI